MEIIPGHPILNALVIFITAFLGSVVGAILGNLGTFIEMYRDYKPKHD